MIEKYNEWLNDKNIKETDKEILKNMSEEEIKQNFNDNLEFGTAGIRGIMGLGTNNINEYTIGKVTVGLANYLNKNFTNPSVVIAYDTRINSKDYAKNVALILNYYGIKTYLFKDYTSTPELSFSVKYLKCTSGIVITSSHNPKEYNGYKVYNSLGGQIVHPEDDLIINEINNVTDFSLIKYAQINNDLFNYVNDEVHEAFLLENEKAICNKNLIKEYANKINITYSSLHGVGIKVAEELLNKYNFNYNIVEEQCTYDGNFTTAPEPNPEYEKNYELAKKIAYKNNSDIIILTDPDADRVGAMIKTYNGYKMINGNVLGALFTNYILNNKKLTDDSYIVKSIVSTPIVAEIAKKHNIKCYDVLTGCKNIADKRNELENKEYIFGFEESLGYMFDINVNDKNGFSSMLSLLEIVCYCKSINITLEEYIDNIYKEYDYYLEETLSFVYKEINGKQIIKQYMSDFRNNKISFENVINIVDYSKIDGKLNTNAIKYEFDDKSWVIIRPSGTEPKIKIYLGVIEKNNEEAKTKLSILKEKISKIFNKK